MIFKNSTLAASIYFFFSSALFAWLTGRLIFNSRWLWVTSAREAACRIARDQGESDDIKHLLRWPCLFLLTTLSPSARWEELISLWRLHFEAFAREQWWSSGWYFCTLQCITLSRESENDLCSLQEAKKSFHLLVFFSKKAKNTAVTGAIWPLC